MPTTETEPRPVRAARAEAKGLVLFAVVKASSKYSYQNREKDGKPVPMEVKALREDHYAFRLANGNDYRLEDLTFFARSPDGKLVKLR
jgi:hypothetical protein